MSSADRREFSGKSANWLRTQPRRYGLAVAAVSAAALARYNLDIAFGFSHSFILFYPTILIIAALAGFWPGFAATILSAAAAQYFFLVPRSPLAAGQLSDGFELGLFCLVGIAISWLTDSTRRRAARLQEFERIVEGLEEMIVVIDRDFRYLIANRAFLDYRGMKRKDVIGRHVAEISHPRVFETEIKQNLEECFRGKVVRYEMRYQYPERGERDLLISYLPIAGLGGVDRIAAVMEDVTEKKRADADLRRSEQRYRMLFEKNLAGVAIATMNGDVLDCNDAWARMLGYGAAREVRGRRTVEFYYNIADREPLLDELKREGSFLSGDMPLKRKDGTPVWVLLNTVILDGKEGLPVVQATAIDISKRRMAESALRRREEEYRQFVAQSSEGIFREELVTPVPVDLPEDELISRIRRDSCVAECNDALARMYGFGSALELAGKRLSDMLVPDDPKNLEMMRQYIRGGFRVLERTTHEVDQHGNDKVFRNSMIGIVENGKLVRTWGIQRDVTKQMRLEEARSNAEDALRASEAHFRALVEQASDGMFIADAQGRYIDVNSAGAEMLGYTRDEILQRSIPDVVAEEDAARVAPEVTRFAGGATVRSEWMFRRKDGSVFSGEVSGKQLPDGRLQGIVRDMTDRKRAEEEMRRSEERFRVALRDSPITVFNQDQELRYTWIYNPQCYWQHDVLGKTDEEILGSKKAASLTELKQRVLKTGMSLREEVAIPNNGASFAFDMTIEPLFDADGRVVGITGACMDIARLREMTDRLQDARDKLAQEKSYLESEIQTELGFEEIIGQSPALRDVLKKARVVAPTDSTVLLLGETGTGKELVARSVHSLSQRCDQTFVKLNCAAVPSGLLESELFGHEKGAFTSAVSQKVGRIELADKGTLFLDEIGELPLELQPKLLRVLQDREFERLGGVHTLRVDVRIIAATNRDLRQDVADKKFREDLFYRLNVFPIELPALRERRGDVEILVQHFVHKHAVRMGKHIDTIQAETMQVLQNWDWPGNIRELENVIERMVIMTKGRMLAPPPAELQASEDSPSGNLTVMEREHIIRILRETNGVLSGTDGAANRLGVKRTTLQSMLKRFNIHLQDYRRGGNGLYGAS